MKTAQIAEGTPHPTRAAENSLAYPELGGPSRDVRLLSVDCVGSARLAYARLRQRSGDGRLILGWTTSRMGDGQAMIRKITGLSLLGTALLGLLPLACQPGGVGDPCTPEDEYTQAFAGYNASEVNVESKSFQCETRVCLVNHFQGRVSCKYGQATATDGNCTVPGDKSLPITQQVSPQLLERTADKAVYCSCRCDGDDKNARYCKCPSGYACSHLVDDLHLGGGQLAGSYCVRDGTGFDPTKQTPCSPVGYPKTPLASGGTLSCGAPDPG